MVPAISRRKMLQAGGAGLAAGLAGCSAVRGLGSEPTELLVNLWNTDRTQSHEVFLDVIHADATNMEDGLVVRKEFALARAADTAEGEEPNEGSRTDFRVESRPYLVRVQFVPTGEIAITAHFHFHPCNSSNADDLDRLFVFLVRDDETDEVSVKFERPLCDSQSEP